MVTAVVFEHECHYCGGPTSAYACISNLGWHDHPDGRKEELVVWPSCCLNCATNDDVDHKSIPVAECPAELLALARRHGTYEYRWITEYKSVKR